MSILGGSRRDAYVDLGWQSTDCPFKVHFPSGLRVSGLIRVVLGHAVRHGWRAYVIRSYGPSVWRVPVDIPNLDVAPLRKFLALPNDPHELAMRRCRRAQSAALGSRDGCE